MSMLTKAVSMTYRPKALRATAVLGLIAMTAIAVGLLILHVQLQFEIRNLGIETRNLQKQRAALRNDLNQLNSGLEGLKLGKRILDYAHSELGMVSFDPAEADTMRVSEARLLEWRRWEPSEKPNRRTGDRTRSKTTRRTESNVRAKQRPTVLDAVLKTKIEMDAAKQS